MKNDQKKIILIYCSIISFGVAIPFIFCFKDPLHTSLDIIKTISIVATSFFALIYFDPFGLNKKRKERQYENVIKILEIIIGKRIIINVEDKNTKSLKGFYQFFITKKNIEKVINEKDNFLNEYLDKDISVDVHNFTEAQKTLIELKNNIWTPKEISNKITLFDVSSLGGGKELSNQDIDIKLQWDGVKKGEDNFVNFLNNKQVTLRKVIEQYTSIINCCETWLTKHSFSAEELNLQ